MSLTLCTSTHVQSITVLLVSLSHYYIHTVNIYHCKHHIILDQDAMRHPTSYHILYLNVLKDINMQT